MILHEIFRVVSCFPRYISCYIVENLYPFGQYRKRGNDQARQKRKDFVGWKTVLKNLYRIGLVTCVSDAAGTSSPLFGQNRRGVGDSACFGT